MKEIDLHWQCPDCEKVNIHKTDIPTILLRKFLCDKCKKEHKLLIVGVPWGEINQENFSKIMIQREG